jgi:hypothetical protein
MKHRNISGSLISSPIFDLQRDQIELAKLMLDRMDILQNLSFRDRNLIIEYYICYWLDTFEKNKPTMAFFLTTPHEVLDFCLYIVFQYLEVPIRLLYETWTFDTKILTNSYVTSEQQFYSIPELASPTPEFINERFERLRESHLIAKHKSILFNESLQKISLLNRISSVIKKVFLSYKSVVRVVNRNFLKLGDELLKSNRINRISYLLSALLLETIEIFKMNLNSISLRKFYLNNTIDSVSDATKYVYFCLQFQPELSTNPCGEIYVNQHLAIAQISRDLPEGWKILVKEHPSQMYKRGFYGHLGRDKSFYSRLLSINNVEFVSQNSDHFKLIDNAQIVSTVTGSVGVEAIARGIPVLIFGNIWYEKLPLVFRVHEVTEEIPMASISQASRKDLDSAGKVLPAINEFLRVSFALPLNSLESELSGYEWDFNANVLTFEKVLDRALSSIDQD